VSAAQAQRERLQLSRKAIADVRSAAAHAPANDVAAAIAIKLARALDLIVDAVEELQKRGTNHV
jgi:hypothetical protein